MHESRDDASDLLEGALLLDARSFGTWKTLC